MCCTERGWGPGEETELCVCARVRVCVSYYWSVHTPEDVILVVLVCFSSDLD
jgi:hypothetical protein